VFWIKFIASPPVLAPIALLVGSVILLIKRGGWPAILQIIGCVAYLIYLFFEIFVAMTGGHEAITSGTLRLPEWTHHWSLSVIRQTLGGLIPLFPVGFIWFVARVTRRT
jgi:hypothetical protein